MSSRIKTKIECGCNAPEKFGLSGWLDGPRTYLWLGTENTFYGSLYGYKLYRLAKAIVRQFEEYE